jgi:hypothetical protein
VWSISLLRRFAADVPFGGRRHKKEVAAGESSVNYEFWPSRKVGPTPQIWINWPDVFGCKYTGGQERKSLVVLDSNI